MDEHTNCNDANRTEDVVFYSQKENRISMERKNGYGGYVVSQYQWNDIVVVEKKKVPLIQNNQKKNHGIFVSSKG